MNHTKSAMFPQRGARKDKTFYNVLFLAVDQLSVEGAFFKQIDTKAQKQAVSRWASQLCNNPKDNWQTHVKGTCAMIDGLISRVEPEFIIISLANIAQFDMLGDMYFLAGGLCEVANRHEINMPVIIKQSEWAKGKSNPIIKKQGNVSSMVLALALAAQGLLFEESL